MTDEAGEAADVRSPSETETDRADTARGGAYWDKRRRQERGGVFVPVEPETRVLTAKQDSFAKKVAAGLSAAQAARLAGYTSPAPEASRMARLPHVRAKIRQYRELKLDKLASASLNVIAEIMLDADVKPETRLKAAQWVAESAGHGPKIRKDSEKDNENNDMREWSIERLEAFLAERERSKRKANSSDAVLIAPDGTMQTTQPIEKTQETLPSQGSAVEDGAAEPPAEPA